MSNSYLLRVIVTPTAVFLSVLFGASYGSGREVVEFVSSNGPSGGLIALATLVATHSVLLILSFEIARLYKAHDYVSFCKVLLRRAWVIYEVVIILGLIIALSITTSVGGTVLEDHFGVPALLGSLAIFGLIVVLSYYGRNIVQKSMMLSVTALFLILGVLMVQIAGSHWDAIGTSFSRVDHEGGAVFKGLIYAIGGGGYIPLLLYCATKLKSRSEAVIAGLAAALIAAVPALIFHLGFMTRYPEIIDQRIPAYWMFREIGATAMLNVYVVVMFVLVAQTGVGVLQGLIQRVDVWSQSKRGVALSPARRALIAGSAAAMSVALGSMGIVALILRGYTIMFASFIFVFVMPLVTYGVYLIVRGTPTANSETIAK
jgi:uncharacterized membrane protein YkvI